MNAHLRTLLEREAAALPVPPEPDFLGPGRRLRRRRRISTGLVTTAVVGALVGGGFVANRAILGTEQLLEPAAARAALERGGAYSIGETLYFGSSTDQAVEIGEPIKSLYYTSAGVVVRSGDKPFTDDSGPSNYALVGYDGKIMPIGLELRDRVPDTSADSPYFVYGDEQGGQWQVVVHDVGADQEVARIDVPGTFTWAGWQAPPVALDGDRVMVAMDDATRSVDWRTGEVRKTPLRGSNFPDVSSGRSLSVTNDYDPKAANAGTVPPEDQTQTATVTDADSGRVLRRITSSGAEEATAATDTFQLSPNGRWLIQGASRVYNESGELLEQQLTVTIHNVDSGAQRTLRIPAEFGWTPSGDLLGLADGTLQECDLAAGVCTTTEADLGRGTVRIGGASYES